MIYDIIAYLFAAALASAIVGMWYFVFTEIKDRKKNKNE